MSSLPSGSSSSSSSSNKSNKKNSDELSPQFSSSSSNRKPPLILTTKPTDHVWVNEEGKEVAAPTKESVQACTEDDFDAVIESAKANHNHIEFDPIPQTELMELVEQGSTQEVTLWRGCTLEKAKNIAQYETAGGIAPTQAENEVRLGENITFQERQKQVQDETRSFLPEFAAKDIKSDGESSIASEGFGRRGAVVIVKIQANLLAPASESESGWVCDHEARVKVQCIIDRSCINVAQIKAARAKSRATILENRESSSDEEDLDASSSSTAATKTQALHKPKKVGFQIQDSDSEEEDLSDQEESATPTANLLSSSSSSSTVSSAEKKPPLKSALKQPKTIAPPSGSDALSSSSSSLATVLSGRSKTLTLQFDQSKEKQTPLKPAQTMQKPSPTTHRPDH